MENCSEKRLSKKVLFAYGCGDFASNLTNTFIGSYLSIYYTDIVGIAPAVVSMIMLLARIWDGINDPMFGAIAERTNTKRGRFRPYIFYFTPLLALSAVFVFMNFGQGKSAVIWASVTYVAYGMLYTVVNLSYGSLSTVMTTNPEDISLLNSWRMMGTNLSSVVLSALSPIILQTLSGSSQYTNSSYTKVILIYSICSIPLFYFLYLNCKETVNVSKQATQVPIRKSIKIVITNKPLMIIFAIQLIVMTAFFGRMGVVIYYIMYNLQRPDLIPLLMSLPSLMTIIGIFVTKNYVIKVGKKKMCALGYLGAGLSLIAMYFTGVNNITLLIVLHGLYGLFCFSFPIPMSMIPEAIDYQEDRTGVRSDGISYATTSLSTKIANALGASVALLIMGSAGYVANAQQSASSIAGINLAVNLIFGVLYLCALIPLYFYPLDANANEEIRIRLENRQLEKA